MNMISTNVLESFWLNKCWKKHNNKMALKAMYNKEMWVKKVINLDIKIFASE